MTVPRAFKSRHTRFVGPCVPQSLAAGLRTADAVTLLRVADADGRRVHAGEIRQVDRARLGAAFEPADASDAGFGPVADLRGPRVEVYWDVRTFL